MSLSDSAAHSSAVLDERRLIKRVLSGERDAFGDLVGAYQAKVLRLCTALLGNATQAEDAAQEIFLKAYQALASFHGHSAFSTWLYRIAANHCKDLLRKRARERTESWETLIEETGEEIADLLSTTEDATTRLAHAELVQRILSQLPPEQRLLLTLREVAGLSYEELAQAMDCSLDAVKSRLRRTREALTERLRHFRRSEHV